MNHPVHQLEDILGIDLPTWETKDKRVLRMRDMSSEHLYKCIVMVERNKRNWRAEYLRPLKQELSLRNFVSFLN